MGMKETPLLFNAPMVKATLADIKSLTRRTRGLEMINKKPDVWTLESICEVTKGLPKNKLNRLGAMFLHPQSSWIDKDHPMREFIPCPYGGIGDRLWVRETWAWGKRYCDDYALTLEKIPKDQPDYAEVWYKADDVKINRTQKWKPSIFMPRWASRITLEITNVMVERLQEITVGDARKEGLFCEPMCEDSDTIMGRHPFVALWDSINGKKYPWSSSPWVWVIEFKRFKR